MKILKCAGHEEAVYTFKQRCPKCGKPTKSAHYKFLRLGNVKDKIDLSEV
ncbi:MAG: nucleolar RNA-binding Nop10p family protein [Nanoarchaeota archaeon]|nr:nucleolar RNA-binding Nop10p family protein [Nanoarchaeota archaeon]